MKDHFTTLILFFLTSIKKIFGQVRSYFLKLKLVINYIWCGTNAKRRKQPFY